MIEIIEEWRPVVGFEDSYEVSSLGRVRSLDRIITGRGGLSFKKRGKLLRPAESLSNGRPKVTLMVDAVPHYRQIQRLVIDAFIGPRPSPRHQCAHNDGDRRNNLPSNLRWATPVENNADKILHGTHQWGERVGTSKLTVAQVRLMRSIKPHFSLTELANLFGISVTTTQRIISRQMWALA